MREVGTGDIETKEMSLFVEDQEYFQDMMEIEDAGQVSLISDPEDLASFGQLEKNEINASLEHLQIAHHPETYSEPEITENDPIFEALPICDQEMDSDDDQICLRRKRSTKFVLDDTSSEEESEEEATQSDFEAIDDSECPETNYLAIQNHVQAKDDFDLQHMIQGKLKSVEVRDDVGPLPLELPQSDSEEELSRIDRLRRQRRKIKAWKMKIQRKNVAKRRRILFD